MFEIMLPWHSKRNSVSTNNIHDVASALHTRLELHQQQVAEHQFREFLEQCSKTAAAAQQHQNASKASKGLSRSASDVKYSEKKPGLAARRAPRRSSSILVQSRLPAGLGSSTTTTTTTTATTATSVGDRVPVAASLSQLGMVSRRRILSRSRDDLSAGGGGGDFSGYEEDEEDVWYQREKLYRDHIQEVLEKWEQIDDEIWAKVIVLERNRRVAKAYARAPVLTINGSDDGFDGFRIGLSGFDNPWRDPKSEEVQRLIGHGVKLKMDDGGNILVKRIAKSNVYVKQTLEETAVGSEVLKLPQGCLELDKPVKLFDFKKFQQNMSRELKRAYPDRRKLEWQCLSALVFVRQEPDLLDCPQWVMLVNMVAMDLLKSKLPPVKRMPDPKASIRPRLPVPEEDPYSLASAGSGSGSGSSGASGRECKRGDRPPKLPPRDSELPKQHYNIPKPDYEDELERKFAQAMSGRAAAKNAKAKEAKKREFEDPYYCGLRARVSNFAGKGPKKDKNIGRPLPNPAAQQHHHLHPMIHHSRSYDSGMASLSGGSHYSYGLDAPSGRGAQYEVRYDPKYDVIRRKMVAPPPLPPHPPGACFKMMHSCHSVPAFDHGKNKNAREMSGGDSPYEKIYGRLPLPNRAYVPAKTRTMFPNGWE